jgi:hypothetical protein
MCTTGMRRRRQGALAKPLAVSALYCAIVGVLSTCGPSAFRAPRSRGSSVLAKVPLRGAVPRQLVCQPLITTSWVGGQPPLETLPLENVYQHRRKLATGRRPGGTLNLDFRMRQGQGTVRSENERRRVKEDLRGDTSVRAIKSQHSKAHPRCFNLWPNSGPLSLQALPSSRDGLVGSWRGMLLNYLCLFHHTHEETLTLTLILSCFTVGHVPVSYFAVDAFSVMTN